MRTILVVLGVFPLVLWFKKMVYDHTAADNVRGSVRWTKPTVKTGPSDSVNIAPAPVSNETR
ncbi:MAG: hypothetical protein ACRD1Q_12905 [Vicinamibacterales bacterium]